jgi:hypothetical protein
MMNRIQTDLQTSNPFGLADFVWQSPRDYSYRLEYFVHFAPN